MESEFLKTLQIVAGVIIVVGMIYICLWVVEGLNSIRSKILAVRGDIAFVHKKLNFAVISLNLLTAVANLFIFAEIIKIVCS